MSPDDLTCPRELPVSTELPFGIFTTRSMIGTLRAAAAVCGAIFGPQSGMNTSMRTNPFLLACFTAVLMHVALAIPSRGQATEPVVDSMLEAVRNGDVDALSGLMGDRLEVGLFGAARLYSRSQARRVLASFFRLHPAARLEVDESVSNAEAWYAGVDYHRSGGLAPLKLYLRLRPSSGGWELREFVVMENPAR